MYPWYQVLSGVWWVCLVSGPFRGWGGYAKYTPGKYTPRQVLTSSGDHRSGGTHPTGMFSASVHYAYIPNFYRIFHEKLSVGKQNPSNDGGYS